MASPVKSPAPEDDIPVTPPPREPVTPEGFAPEGTPRVRDYDTPTPHPPPPEPQPSRRFRALRELSPQSLFRRYLVTQQHILGLIFGGGFAWIRYKRAEGINYSIIILLVRGILALAYPFLDKELIAQPFPIQFRRRLERMGPTYIKLGQILSLRQDLLPHSIIVELQNLLDDLPGITFESFLAVVHNDLNIPPQHAFAWIDPIPLGSASLAQTHRARLHTDEQVVIKAIKPGVRATITQDCTLLDILGNVLQIFLARYQPRRTIHEFTTYTLREIDLRFEAENAETFTVNFQNHENIAFPHIYRHLSGRDVLCMEYFAGAKPNTADASGLDPIERARIIDLGVTAVIKMIFEDGFFHADMHPGNLIIFADNRIGFIDLGMVGRVEDETRKGMLHYFYSLVMGDAENAARILTTIAISGYRSDLDGFRREVTDLNRRWLSASQYHNFSIAQLILQSIILAGRYRIYYPGAIILMVKALITVEGLAHLLEPKLELVAVARPHVRRIILSEFNPVDIFHKVLIHGPEFLDILFRSPLILARTLHRWEKFKQSTSDQPWRGLREIVLAGFCLISAAILLTGGVAWPYWLLLLIIGFILGARGLR